MRHWPNPAEYIKRPTPSGEFGGWRPSEEFFSSVLRDFERFPKDAENFEFSANLEAADGRVFRLECYARRARGEGGMLYSRVYVWGLYDDRGELVGAGSLYKKYSDGSARSELKVVGGAALHESLRGQKLYSKILRVLRARLGPLGSSYALSPSSYYAWVDAGAAQEKSDVGSYFRLNPRQKQRFA